MRMCVICCQKNMCLEEVNLGEGGGCRDAALLVMGCGMGVPFIDL